MSRNNRGKWNENGRCEGSPPLTLTHSLLLTLNTLLITYFSLIVFTISQNIQHNIVPINVANSINPVSILYFVALTELLLHLLQTLI